MKRSQLAHILRAAFSAIGDSEILVIGSQSILATFGEDELPPAATRSIEADIAFFDDADEKKSDSVDGAIGEQTPFHESFGIYGQGVGLATAVLPAGWENRLVAFDDPEAWPARAYCLDPYDLVVSKLVAGREKDRAFAKALLEDGTISVTRLREHADLLSGPPVDKRRVIKWIESWSKVALDDDADAPRSTGD